MSDPGPLSPESIRRSPATSDAAFEAERISCLTARFQNHLEMKFRGYSLRSGPGYWALKLQAKVYPFESWAMPEYPDPSWAANWELTYAPHPVRK